jgi:hypothetical protein
MTNERVDGMKLFIVYGGDKSGKFFKNNQVLGKNLLTAATSWPLMRFAKKKKLNQKRGRTHLFCIVCNHHGEWVEKNENLLLFPSRLYYLVTIKIKVLLIYY